MISACIVFAITIIMIFAYIQGKTRIEIISITLIATLMLFVHLYGYGYIKLLQAFSNPAIVTIVGMLIISRAIIVNNSFNILNKLILHPANQYPTVTTSIMLVIAFACSACINNTPIVAIFIPLMELVTKKFHIMNSKVMMSLAFSTSLGGLLTVFGSSTNLLIHNSLHDMGYNIGFFDFIFPGSIIAIIGLIYTVLILPRIMPTITPSYKEFLNEKFVIKIIIPKNSKFINKSIEEVISAMHVLALQSGGQYFYNYKNKLLNADDIIFLNITKEELTHLLSNKAELIIHNSEYTNKDGKVCENLIVREVITPTNTDIIGKTLDSIKYYSSAKVFALGIQRASSLLNSNLNKIVLKAGDKILLVGDKTSINEFIKTYNFINANVFSQYIPKHTNALFVNLIFAGVVLIASFKILPIVVSVMVGIMLLLITKCINIKQIKSAFDLKVFLIISSAYMLSVALQESGGIQYITDVISHISYGLHPLVIMVIFFITIALLNEIVSNNAIGLIFTPIIIGIAETTDADPRLFIWGLIFASNCAFSTPIAYQTNLLVMGPGNYKFTDYYKVGIPLTALIGVSYTIFAYFYFKTT